MTRALRDIYAPPSEGYWDGLESRVMAAVRAGRGSTTAVVEWWHTLAAWTRPGLAAASVVLAVVAATLLQQRAAHVAATAAEHPSVLEPMDAELARALDLLDAEPVAPEDAKAARDRAELLVDGVSRRPRVALPPAAPARETEPSADVERDEVLRARREATFRYVMP